MKAYGEVWKWAVQSSSSDDELQEGFESSRTLLSAWCNHVYTWTTCLQCAPAVSTVILTLSNYWLLPLRNYWSRLLWHQRSSAIPLTLSRSYLGSYGLFFFTMRRPTQTTFIHLLDPLGLMYELVAHTSKSTTSSSNISHQIPCFMPLSRHTVILADCRWNN